MEGNNLKKILACIAAIATFFVMSVPVQAQAATGWLSKNELFSECYVGPNANCTPDTINTTEVHCDCTGDLAKTWKDADGRKHRKYAYNNSWGVGEAAINFRLNKAGTKWLATDGGWCGQDGCFYVYGV